MPAHSDQAGRIILEEAYAASKMLDNSSWNGLLRDRITPSDIDHPSAPLCFDNRGAVVFADFSINCTSWKQLGGTLKGQRLLYEALVRYGPHCAALLKHGVMPEMRRQIDTLRDVESFQVMLWDFEPVLSPIYPGAFWQDFITTWVNEPNGPLRIRRNVLGTSVGLTKPKAPSMTDVSGDARQLGAVANEVVAALRIQAPPTFSLETQIAEIDFEIKKRRQVYARLVNAKKLKAAAAGYKIDCMLAVRASLVKVQALGASP